VSQRTRLRPTRASDRDEGSALIVALAFIIIGALFVTPMMRYAMAVTKSGTVQEQKISRAEAVKAAFRTAMADPSKLYDTCSASGLHNSVSLAGPGLGVAVTTECTTLKNTLQLNATELRSAMATTYVGSTAPVGTVGAVYPNSGNANENLWIADATTVSTAGKILLPNLPSRALANRSNVGYAMPAWAGNCRAYFPGTYSDPIVLTSTQPVFFASGIYYFENTVTVSGSAKVVVGGGAAEGCTDDQQAAFNALGAPKAHNINGYGATWIFGAAGRLVFTDTVAGTGPSLQFNSRLVGDTDVGSLSSRGVSIMSVNGVDGGGLAVDFSLPGKILVPRSLNSANPPVEAMVDGYEPSTLRPDGVTNVYPAIIDINLTTTNPAVLWISGAVVVPQGNINIAISNPAAAAGKNVQLVGGVLAAYFTQTVDKPAVAQFGILNRVVQKTFKVVSRTTTGVPMIVSSAIVQINDYGEYVVNTWEVAGA